MGWQLFISGRYLTSTHKERFISLISLISILGVAVGVAALIIVISVMSGFDEDLKAKIIGTSSHLEVTGHGNLEAGRGIVSTILATPHVVAASPFLHGQGLLQAGESVVGVIVKGIEPATEVEVNRIGEYIVGGELALDEYGVVVGSELAARMGLVPGSTVTVVSPDSIDGIDFIVSGIFRSGMYEYDSALVYAGLPATQELLRSPGMVTGYAVRVDDVFHVDGAKRALRQALGPSVVVRSWLDMNRNLMEALKLEKTVMFIILALIVMVACFNIAGTLIMTVLEKTRDIGILKAIGASRANIMLIFALQGTSIGIVGTAIGAGLGLAACWCLKTYKFITLPQDVYYIDKLPVKFAVGDITVIVGASILISIIATIYPAYRASRLDPVEALRYE